MGRLVDMGFSRPQAEDALMKSGGDPDLAAEQLMTQVCVCACACYMGVQTCWAVFFSFSCGRLGIIAGRALLTLLKNNSGPPQKQPVVVAVRCSYDSGTEPSYAA